MIKYKNFLKKTFSVILFTIATLLVSFLVELISRESIPETFNYIKTNLTIFLYNTSIVMLTLVPIFLLKKRLFYFVLASSAWIILSIGNLLTLTFRGTPLTASDLGMLHNALTLAEQYISKSTFIFLSTALAILIILLAFIYIKCKNTEINYKITIPLILVYCISFTFINNYVLSKGIVSKNFWDVTLKYSEYGFPFSFSNSLINNGIKRPDYYSKSIVNTIYSDIILLSSNDSENAFASDSKYFNLSKPNIIIVQLESFIDPTWIETVEFNKDPIPNFRSLSNTFTSGLTTVPTAGGGTANTEFEVITGLPVNYFGVGEFPYNTIASNKEIPSLAYTLKNIGYTSHALHNHEAVFYSRNNVYQNLGFDSFTPIETMSPSERTPVGWSKDTILVSEIEDLLTYSHGPDLIFAISVQGHGGYPDVELEDKEIEIINDYDGGNKNSIEYFTNQVYEMDIFIGELIEMVNTLDEPTIIAFYGDHHPVLGVASQNFTTKSIMTTPYLIWDNIGLAKEDENIKTYELVSKVLKDTLLPQTVFMDVHNSNLSEEDKYEFLHLLGYDQIYGKNYLSTEPLTKSDDFSYGLKVPEITEFIEVNDTISIIGHNFNTFSRVSVNGTLIDSTFIDENTINIDINKIKSGNSIEIKQIAGNSTLELLTSDSKKY